MKKITSSEVAFDVWTDFMARMIQKYGDSIDIPKDNQIKCDSSLKKKKNPADNTESSAVVCMRESDFSDKSEV